MAIELTTLTAQQRSDIKSNIAGIETITTGAAPVNADPDKRITFIISGGTGGDEIVNLPDVAYEISSYGDPTKIGNQKIFILLTQTDPADVVKVRASGAGGYEFSAYDNVRNRMGTCAEGVLDYAASSFEVEWTNAEWAFNFRSFDNSSDITGRAKYAPSTDGGSVGEIVQFDGGAWAKNADAGCVNGIQLLTTGVAPVQANPNLHCTRITSGGTAGTESVTFNAIPLNEAGAEHVFRFVSQVDPADVVSIETAHIKTSADAATASIHLLAVDDMVHVKMSILGWWRIVEIAGTATVTPA